MTINENIQDIALSWVIKVKEGLSQTEKKDFEKFIANKLNKEAFDRSQSFLTNFNKLEEEDKDSIKEDIENDKKISRFTQIFTPIAASILLISFLTYFYFDNKKITYHKEYQTYNTKKVNIHLPDDSFIDLDAKSILNINYYKNKRFVNFRSGKAVFSISKNKKRPFIIKCGNTQIEVIGTKFEVINLQNINIINVIEGVVKVSHLFNEKLKSLIVLRKGQSFRLNSQGKNLKLQNVDIKNIAQWKNDLIKFEKSTLEEALKEFERYTDRKIIFKDYKIANYKISGVFSIKELDKFIDALPEIYPIKIIKSNNKIELMSIIE